MLLFGYLVLLLTYRARILQIFGRCNSFPHFSKLRNLDAEQKYKKEGTGSNSVSEDCQPGGHTKFKGWKWLRDVL